MRSDLRKRHDLVRALNTPERVVHDPTPGEVKGQAQARANPQTTHRPEKAPLHEQEQLQTAPSPSIEACLQKLASESDRRPRPFVNQIDANKPHWIIRGRRGILKSIVNGAPGSTLQPAVAVLVTLQDGDGGIPWSISVAANAVLTQLEIPFFHGLYVVSCVDPSTGNPISPVLACGTYDAS